MKWFSPITMLLAAGLAALLIDGPPTVRGPTQQLGAVAVRAAPAYRGLAIQVDTSHRPLQRYGPMVRQIADLGADTVLFSVNAYQTDAGATDIHVDPRKTPEDAIWRALLRLARDCGLRIVLMPKILLSAPRGQEWRGVINPGRQWSVWFARYGDFIMHYARLAADCDVDVFVVGSELLTAEKHTGRWRQLIAEVRGVFDGLLTYSANWDHYAAVQFWDDLDLVAMTSYYRTAEGLEPTRAMMVSTWRSIRSEILEWQSRIGRPILFTEVGWCSQRGCSLAPWNYHYNPVASVTGLREQRLNYEAFIQVWNDQPAVAGVIWWEWAHHGGGSSDYGYTPKNKPAQAVLQDWFTGAATRSPGDPP